jgi:phosphatidylserine/phosphatidylglycerophosphate/cardiolipin synthase-like enzyme
MMMDAGIGVHYMVSNSSADIYARYSYLHGKYIVVDGSTVLVSSENFGTHSFPEAGKLGNRGWAVILNSKGLASRLQTVFQADGDLKKSDIHEPVVEKWEELVGYEDSYYKKWFSSKFVDQTVPGELLLGPDNSVQGVINLLSSATEEILVQQMELELLWEDGVLSPHIQTLLDRAEAGVKVSVLVDSKYVEIGGFENNERQSSDWYLDLNSTDEMDSINFINAYAEENGLPNLEARLCYLGGLNQVHNKGVIVDGKKVLVSSMNWNEHSFTLNREVGVVLHNENISRYYRDAFLLDWQRSPSTKALPTGDPPGILITKVYYDSNLLYEPNEFVAIHNPTANAVDLGGWYITDQDSHYTGYEATVVFPKGDNIAPSQTIYMTKNARDFQAEMGFLPDYEYAVISGLGVTHLDVIGGDMVLSNNGDEVFLKDKHNRIVDMLCWGESDYIGTGWSGTPAKDVPEGKILVRNRDEAGFVDTDTYLDWKTPREYVPGQSDFDPTYFNTTGEITAFVSPDCSYQALTQWMQNATSTLYLNVYQFHNVYLMQTLVNLSLKGVEVKVLIDGDPVGGLTDAGRYVGEQLHLAGCDVRYWISDRSNNIFKRYRFDHAKYCVVDNQSVAVLSENWKLTGVPVGPDYGNRGWGVIAQDQGLAKHLADVFFFDFDPNRNDTFGYDPDSFEYGPPPSDFQPPLEIPSGDYYKRFGPLTVTTEASITPVISPDTSLNTVGSIISLIDSATEYICVQQLSCELDWVHGKDVGYRWWDKENYYLFWDDGETYYNSYLKALIDAARRGVDVKVILDSNFIDYNDYDDNDDVVFYLNEVAKLEGLSLVAKLYYPYNVQGKSRYEIIHNKGVIVDGEKVLVSSINWVLGSVGRNREMGLIIENTDVTAYYQKVFDFDWGIDMAETISAEVLYSDLHNVENGSGTGFAIRLSNLGNTSLSVSLSVIWLADKVTTEVPANFVVALDTTNLSLGPNGKREIVLEVNTPRSVNGTLNQSLGLRLYFQGYYTDLVFMTVVVKNLTGASINGTQESDEERDKEKAKTNYTIPAVLGIVILILVIVIFALVRDKLKEREGMPLEEEEDDVGEEEGVEEEKEKEIDEDELDQLEPPDFEDEEDFDEDLMDELDLEEEDIIDDEELLGELDLEEDDPDLD